MTPRTRSPWRRNAVVWLLLLLLLALSAGSASLPLGRANSVLNLAIAAAKALLVALYFMHLRTAGALLRLAAGIALFMLLPLFGLSGADYLNRRLPPAPWQAPRVLPALPPGPQAHSERGS